MLRIPLGRCTVRRFSSRHRLSGRLSSSEARLSAEKKNQLRAVNRLVKVAELLDSSKRLKYTTMDCYKIYDSEKFTLVDDFLAVRDHESQHIVFANYKNSKLMAAFILDQISTMLIKGREEQAVKFLSIMEENGLLDRKNSSTLHMLANNTLPTSRIRTYLSCVLVRENLRTGEPLVAALCALKLLAHDAAIDPSTLTALIQSLSVNTPNRKTYHAYTICKLLKTFKNYDVDEQVKIDAVQSMLGGPVVPYFANVCFDEMMEQKENMTHPSFLRLAAQIIDANLENGNTLRCVQLWKQMYKRDPSFAEKYMVLFSKIIDKLADHEHERAMELADKYFPAEIRKDPQAIDSLLSLYGQNSKLVSKFEQLTHELKSPLLRSTLSVLFAAFLFQSNEVAAERILQAIFSTKNGLTPDDFKTIIKRLLRQQKIKQSVTMCESTDFSVAKGGYVGTIEFLLTHPPQSLHSACDIKPQQLDKLKHDFFALAVRKFKLLERDDPALTNLTVSIFKYLSGHISNKASRKLYIVFLSTYVALKPYFAFQLYQMPKEFNDLVHIDKSNRLTCLTIILNRAIGEKDRTTIEWALAELVAMGLLEGEIEVNYLTPEVAAILNDK